MPSVSWGCKHDDYQMPQLRSSNKPLYWLSDEWSLTIPFSGRWQQTRKTSVPAIFVYHRTGCVHCYGDKPNIILLADRWLPTRMFIRSLTCIVFEPVTFHTHKKKICWGFSFVVSGPTARKVILRYIVALVIENWVSASSDLLLTHGTIDCLFLFYICFMA